MREDFYALEWQVADGWINLTNQDFYVCLVDEKKQRKQYNLVPRARRKALGTRLKTIASLQAVPSPPPPPRRTFWLPILSTACHAGYNILVSGNCLFQSSVRVLVLTRRHVGSGNEIGRTGKRHWRSKRAEFRSTRVYKWNITHFTFSDLQKCSGVKILPVTTPIQTDALPNHKGYIADKVDEINIRHDLLTFQITRYSSLFISRLIDSQGNCRGGLL